MKRIVIVALLVVLLAGAFLAGQVTAKSADIVLPINNLAPQGISCEDGGVIVPVVDETVQPIGNRYDVWCLPFHPGKQVNR